MPRSSGATPALGPSSRGHRQRARTRQPPQRAQGCVRGDANSNPTCASTCTTTPMPAHGRGGAMQFTSHATLHPCAGQRQAPGRLRRSSRGFEPHQPVPGLLASGAIERAARRAGARIIRHHSGKEVGNVGACAYGCSVAFIALRGTGRGAGRISAAARNPSWLAGSRHEVKCPPHEQAAMTRRKPQPPQR